MLTFAVKKKHTSSIAPKRHAPTVSPMSHSLHLQQAKVRHILRSPTLQPKLKIGRPNDKYEQEADRVADKVMRMPEPKLQRQYPEYEEGLQRQPVGEEKDMVQPKPIAEQITPLVQRQVEPEKEEEDEELIQAKIARDVTPEVTPATSSGIQSLQGGGRSLSESERSFFEPRFGADFSSVRVHDDTRAAGIAQSVNARAFTLGRDVVFGAGEYSSDEMTGKKLFAHELTHVVQQRKLGGQSSTTVRCDLVDFMDRVNALPIVAGRRIERLWEDLDSDSVVHFWCNFAYTLLDEEVSAFEEANGEHRQRDSSGGEIADIFSLITSRAPRLTTSRRQIADPSMAPPVTVSRRQITDQDWEIVGATLDTAKCRVWHDRPRTANFSNIGIIVSDYGLENRGSEPAILVDPNRFWNMQNINQARRNYIDAMIRELPTLQNGPTHLQKQLAELALIIFKERNHPQNLTYLLPGHPIASQSTNHWVRARLNHIRIPPGPIEQVLGSWTPDFIVGSGY
jgi:hypothetical protein